jgi:hypothetical protein
MRLVLGGREYDLRMRALVAAAITPPRLGFDLDCVLADAARAVAAGADVLDLMADGRDRDVLAAVDALRERFDVPLAVTVTDAASLTGAARAGAALVSLAAGAALLATAAGLDTEIAVRLPVPPGVAGTRAGLRAAADQAARAGLEGHRVVLELSGGNPDVSRTVAHGGGGEAGPGPVVQLSIPADQSRAAVASLAALGVASGCRLVRSVQVRAARRAVDVVAAVMEAAVTEAGVTEAAVIKARAL